jgi:CheY-like chemotaxis protein
MYGDYLRHHRLDVEERATPEEALESVERQPPDVLVTELVFARKRMTGPSFIQTVRGIVDPATSIIVVSGFVRHEDREIAREAGADVFLPKPALPRDVLYEVRRALAAKSEGQRLSWNWTAPPDPPPAVERRTYSFTAPLMLAADLPPRRAKA